MTPAALPRPWRRRAPRVADAAESSFETLRWQRERGAARRWALWGAIGGALVAMPLFAPAAWLAGWVGNATGGHLQLADARGSLWTGSAVAVLAGGHGSRDARALPGRLQWQLRPALDGRRPALQLALQQACCLNGSPTLLLTPGLGTLAVRLAGGSGGLGQWPAGWLAGLGTPWNTLQLGGVLRLATPGIAFTWASGRWAVDGSATLEVLDAAARVSTLERLGSYRLELGADPEIPGNASLRLSTVDGALRLSGHGTLGAGGLRFRGEASSAGPDAAALANLLNIIGRRDGARSVIAIG